MLPLSVTIIARDEEDRIGAAIRSVAFADEVLVLDSGSADRTVEVARGLGARVIETDWPGHVAQKNRALALARHRWVLSIDADERVDATLAEQIAALRAGDPDRAGYRFPRLSWWQGRPIWHGNWYPDDRIRLVDRHKAEWVGDDPHDSLEVDGPVGRLRGHLQHHPFRSLSEHLRTIDRYTATAADRAMAAGRRARWWDVVFRPPLHFAKAMLLRAGFADGLRGWALAGLGATYVLLKWTRIALRIPGQPVPAQGPLRAGRPFRVRGPVLDQER